MKIPLPKPVQAALALLNGAGFEAYVVGGAVRDALLGRDPGDFDIATDATPEQVGELFAGNHWGVAATGEAHGTMTVIWEHYPIEVTTYRTEGTYTDHRRPDGVRFTASLEEDLARRDFTVNAMAYHPKTGLVDPYDGRGDMKRKLLRCVGKPGVAGEADRRFAEDALRMLRALRFASRLGFVIEKDTARAIYAHKEDLAFVAAERIKQEMDKLLLGENRGPVLTEYAEIIGEFIPEMVPCIGFDQHTVYHKYNVWEHCAVAAQNARLSLQTKEALAEAGIDEKQTLLQLRWAAMLHDIEKPACFFTDEEGNGHFYGHSDLGAKTVGQVLRRLRFDNESRHKIVMLVENHDRQFVLSKRPIKRAIRKFGKQDLLLLMDLYSADCSAQSELAYERLLGHELMRNLVVALTNEENAAFSRKDLAVDGRDVMALGYEGTQIGRALEVVLNEVVDGNLPNQKEDILRYLTDNKESFQVTEN